MSRRAVIACRSASLTSWSRCASSRDRAFTIVTRTPSAANTHAYSQPITPPPTTIIEAGIRCSVSSESLSTTTSPSTAYPRGAWGAEPGARRNRAPVT